MANKDEKKFYKTSFFICSSFIFGPLGALISWLILKFQKNKKLKNQQNEEQLLEKLALLKNKDVENDDRKNEIDNEKLVAFYKNILAEFDTLFSKQSKDVAEIKNQNTKATIGADQILEQTKTTKNNNLLEEVMKVKNNLRRVEPQPNSVMKTTKNNDLLEEVMKVKNNLRRVEPQPNSVMKTTKNNDLLEEVMKVKNNLRRVEPQPRSFTNIIIPNPTIKPNLLNWQKEQIKSVNKQLNSIKQENESNKNIDEKTR
ncbi:hypothetical protein [Spiroplasma citri]|uniref:Hypothetical transmembrane protein n=1 Tax=Spiroplasma citri TaxID=2133 RepID=Q14N34_SPICI|nr:hypothetical protein [Spiroplasma citri]APE74817.1 hypothetical protein SCITRI_00928 [Spiroplasma citri]QIA67062.1 hypothetical protein GMI18_05035 [Spiroplasma citri]QIA68926.1 hypothetical protein GL298_05035 [Spiroplasma citri]QIA70788.1 hypothetical protein GL981_05055 [Spiroplasma citri]QIA72847.1 hypothetical protein GL982_03935 [Spiroplasma citri]